MPDAPFTSARDGNGGVRGRRVPSFLGALVLTLLGFAAPVSAAHDPNRTVTIFVHGFDRDRVDEPAVYGRDIRETLQDQIAAMAGLPVGDTTGGPIAPNAVTATTYYGNTAPAYYTSEDRAEIDRLNSVWGGGVPRYAYIVARYAQHVMERSGADQVNIVSASLGSLVARWMIEKNVAGLAGSGRIARWLTIEGLIAGNWVASRDELIDYLEFLQPQPIDVDHMSYGWVEANLHSPRGQADHPYYASILIGQTASTDDTGNQGGLSALMHTYNEFMPNDGVQALPDARFQTVTTQSRYLGLAPTLSLFHADHLGIKHHRGAYAQAATFVTARRRVTVRLTHARVMNLREPQLPFWDWRPAEVVFESWAHAPAAEARWGFDRPLSARSKEDTAAPLRRYQNAGETQILNEIVFDDLVLPEETELRIVLHAAEADYDPHYGVFETLSAPYYDDMGGGTVMVSALYPGTYTLATPEWSCELSVDVFEYPSEGLRVDVPLAPGASPSSVRSLRIAPNPSASSVRIGLSGLAPAHAGESARLEIADLSGRLVRAIEGRVGEGFFWDGRDEQGVAVPAGVYLHRVVTSAGTWTGRSCRLK